MNRKNAIALGTAAIGRPLYINIKQDADNREFSLPQFRENGLQVLEDAYEKGIRIFDTSPGYGLSEQLLIDWLNKKQDRTVQVYSKWGYSYVANFDPNAKVHEVKEHSLDKLNRQWEFTKMLLPYLTVYQIHSATFDTGVLDNELVLRRLHEIKKENNLRIGLTTTGTEQTAVLKKAMDIEVDGEKLFGSFQCTFNVFEQSIGELQEILDEYEDRLIIKESLANGRLIPNTKYEGFQPLYQYLMALAMKYNVGADAIAIRYCLERFPKATVLSGANNSIHLTTNLRANGFQLNEEEIERLNGFKIPSEEYWQDRKELQWN